MSRVLLLIFFLLWMAPWSANDHPQWVPPAQGVILFFAGLAILVLAMAVWSRRLARKVLAGNVQQSTKRFTKAMSFARMMIPAWFAIGLFILGWKRVVDSILGSQHLYGMELPGALTGTFPAFLAWMGLWWAQYPADRALREQ